MFLNWFYNLSLAKKLISTFFIVMSFTVFLGIFSIARLRIENDNLAVMSNRWVPSIQLLADLSAETRNLRRLETLYILSPPDDRREYDAKRASSLQQIEKDLAAYGALASLPEEKELFQGFSKEWRAYLENHNEVMRLSLAGETANAMSLSNGGANSTFESAAQKLTKSRELTAAGARGAADGGARIYVNSRNLILALILASFLVGGWLINFIVRKVTCRSLWWALKSLENVANGDLRQEIRVKSTEEIGAIFSSLKKIIDKLREFSGEVNHLTRTLSDNSKALISTTETMNRSAHEQAGETEQLANAVLEMSQTLQDMAGTADQASRASKDTSEAANNGLTTVAEVMQEMRKIVESMQESSETIGKLGASSAQIGDIVSTIEEVADQTNLLALNAAIEAARAGEHGRGFAVVADEVRALAERTAKATREIGSMIKTIQSDTDLAVTCMTASRKEADGGLVKAQDASRALERIVEASNKSMDLIQVIAAATEEQSAVTAKVSSNIETIASGTRYAESSAGLIQESAQDLARLSGDLERAAAWFKVA